MTMYDMTRVNTNGYFDSEDTADARYEKKAAMNSVLRIIKAEITRLPAAWSIRFRKTRRSL